MAEGLHPAVRGFDRAAESYERGRPGYPSEALDFLAKSLEIRPGRRVLELGAGTGKFTRAMRPWSVRRIAIEPIAGMRDVFRRTSGDAELVVARAEALPVRDGTIDAVVAAQSFHWFRQPQTSREIHRVLRSEGGVGLVWNRRDESVPWVARLGRIIDAEAGEIPRTRSTVWRSAFDDGIRFGPIASQVFGHRDRTTPDGVVDRVLSISGIGLLSPERQRDVARRVREIVAGDPAIAGAGQIDFPYRTEVYVIRRRAEPAADASGAA